MMKLIFAVLVFCVAVSAAYAQPATTAQVPVQAATPVAEQVTLSGTIIDNTCAGAHQDDMAAFIITHTKECALMPGCVESGYSIFADGKLSKFDKDSSAKIAAFLKMPDSKLQVVVIADKAGEELSLVSIANQK
jgi:hypothetical protein